MGIISDGTPITAIYLGITKVYPNVIKILDSNKTTGTSSVEVTNGLQYFAIRSGLVNGSTSTTGITASTSFILNGSTQYGIVCSCEGYLGTTTSTKIGFSRYNNSGYNTSVAIPIEGEITDTFNSDSSWSATIGEYFLVCCGGDYKSPSLTGATPVCILFNWHVGWQSLDGGGYVSIYRATSTTISASNYGTGIRHLSLGKTVSIE